MRVSVESGSRRTFAESCDWPGWCRSGKNEATAIVALAGYGPRFAQVARRAGVVFLAPAVESIEVVERLEGGPVTDYGAITRPIVSDRDALTPHARDLAARLLVAAWAAFDEELARVPAKVRAVKPKVGRSPDGFRLHLYETDSWHLSAYGGKYKPPAAESLLEGEPRVRAALLDGLGRLPTDEPFEPFRARGMEWTPVFAARRSIWHALDHAWQLEDQRMEREAGSA